IANWSWSEEEPGMPASSRGMPRARHCLLFVALFLDLSLYAGGQDGYVSLSAFERILQGDTGQPEDPL
ncbi:unnamed protein product, partial [Polarella glacialis]